MIGSKRSASGGVGKEEDEDFFLSFFQKDEGGLG